MPGNQSETSQLAEKIVRVQGTIFIRELLRAKRRSGLSVRIGIRKDEVLANLLTAIEDGHITFQDLTEWLEEVEGWGRHHVYLFRPTQRAIHLPIFNSEEAFQDHVAQVGISTDDSGSRLLFPEKLTLDTVSFDGVIVQLAWKRGRHELVRDSGRDREDVIEGDRYVFKAWRDEPRRVLQRFIMKPADQVAALFVQIPLGLEHSETVDMAREAIAQLVPPEELPAVSISQAVMALDEADLDGHPGQLSDNRGQIQPQDTKFRALGASVQFSADPTLVSYNEIEPVRHVRQALQPEDFSGEFARFTIQLESGTGMSRSVKMYLHGNDNRFYLHSRMTREEVWAVLSKIHEVTQ